MTQIFLIVIGLIIIGLLVFKRTREPIVGVCEVAIESNAKKRERKEKVLALLAERSVASNADIREALQISERTATRYMEELEQEGKVEQIGSTGRSVNYRLK